MDQYPMMQYLLDPQLLMVLVVVLPLAFWAGWGSRIRHLAAGSVVCVLLFIAGIIADNSYLEREACVCAPAEKCCISGK